MMMTGSNRITIMIAQDAIDEEFLLYYAALMGTQARTYYNRPHHVRLTFHKPADAEVLKEAVRNFWFINLYNGLWKGA